MSTENQHPKVAIVIAIITVIGSLGAALLANWDKVFSSQDSTALPSSQPSTSSSSPSVSSSVPEPLPSPTPVFTEPVIPSLQWSDNATGLRGRLDQDFTYACPAAGRIGTVWGTNTYTDDSSICSAAVHVGLITAKDGGQVTIRIRPGETSYVGMTRNGVMSNGYGDWRGSFIFVK